MDLLKSVNEWVQKGFEITYEVINQIDNGYNDEVQAGNMPNFTYTIYIYNTEEEEEELWLRSVDTLEEGFNLAVNWLKDNR